MSIRFGLVVGLLFAIVVTYLTSINPNRVRIALGGDWAFDLPLMALIAVVFGAGAGLALVLGILRDVTRSYTRRPDPLEPPARVLPEPRGPVEAPRDAGRPSAPHAQRDALIERGRFAEALPIQTRVVQAAPRGERAAAEALLASLHYETGRERLEKGDRGGAIAHLK
ncbi:MAG TPA: hypothetical protein VLK35_16285, partial [Methylomirabilota bacterium]|nr:hypothetical protein [Methylomirabilota bacterium]